MEFKLNVYQDCASEEPSKTYVCRRILFKTAMKLADLQAKSEKSSDGDQRSIMAEMLKAVFPDFEESDIDGIDPIELGAFFKGVGSSINQVLANAQKN